MKKLIFAGLLLAGSLAGCEKSETLMYEQRAAVYCESSAYNYSFMYDPDADFKVLELAVTVSGFPVDFDREFLVSRPQPDTLTTAEDDQYMLGTGIVRANELSGHVSVRVNRDDRLADSTYVLAWEIVPNADFPEVRLSQKTMLLSFTERAIKPANWNEIKYYFGNVYSSELWTFVCEATGKTEFPYLPGKDPDDTEHMSVAEMEAYQTIVSLALDEYNDTHPGQPLTHLTDVDEGHEGEKVEVPMP